MKTYLFLVCCFLALSFPTLASDLDDFYQNVGTVHLDKNYSVDIKKYAGDKAALISSSLHDTGRRMMGFGTTYLMQFKIVESQVIDHVGDIVWISSPYYGSNYRKVINKLDSGFKHALSKSYNNRDLATLDKLINDFSPHAISIAAKEKKEELLLVLEKEELQFQKAISKGEIESLEQFIANFPKSNNVNDAKHAIYKIVERESSIERLTWHAKMYPEIEHDKNFVFNLVKNINTLESYIWFEKDYSNSQYSANAIKQVYRITESENNISGYNWFIKKYPSSKQAKKALNNMHKLAFELAEGIDTINAYNDFVIAYPTAKQVRTANEMAYELEKSEYKSMLSFFSEEKDARRLLVQSKMLEQSAEGLSSDEKVGYMMVVNRMNDLLKQEFNSTDATLRHLESNEFKSFVRAFKSSMSDLKRQVSRIADNTADLSSIMKQQSSMMNNHFENAAQDREMASELTKQHRHWERFIGEVGQ